MASRIEAKIAAPPRVRASAVATGVGTMSQHKMGARRPAHRRVVTSHRAGPSQRSVRPSHSRPARGHSTALHPRSARPVAISLASLPPVRLDLHARVQGWDTPMCVVSVPTVSPRLHRHCPNRFDSLPSLPVGTKNRATRASRVVRIRRHRKSVVGVVGRCESRRVRSGRHRPDRSGERARRLQQHRGDAHLRDELAEVSTRMWPEGTRT